MLKRVIRYPNENWKEQEVIKMTMKEGVVMSKASVKFEAVKEQLMKDKEFQDEYEKLKPRYEIISQIIEARKEQNITQEELALRVRRKPMP